MMMMENRLNKALVRYNTNLGRLADLRSQIDELRKDRANFRQMIRDACSTQEKKDGQMATLISESNNTYAERDRRKMELARLQAAEKSDVQAYEQRVELLNQEITNQKAAQNRPVGHQTMDQQSESATAPSDQQEELSELTEQLHRTNQRTLDLCEMRSVNELFAEAERLEQENFSWLNYVMDRGAARARLEQEIEGLEMQRNVLFIQAEAGEEQQSAILDRLTKDIQQVEAELNALTSRKAEDEAEFREIYTDIGALFTDLGCSWDEAPDGKTTVTPGNSMFCLSGIEGIVAEMIGQMYEKTRSFCSWHDIKPTGFLPNDRGHVSHSASGPKPPEKEVAAKVTDSTRSLSIEELRSMLD
jgi:chromosome segregation ATPase